MTTLTLLMIHTATTTLTLLLLMSMYPSYVVCLVISRTTLITTLKHGIYHHIDTHVPNALWVVIISNTNSIPMPYKHIHWRYTSIQHFHMNGIHWVCVH